ncbi:MAG: ATP-grasp domain-containing protein [Nannocystaceae bacterium]|nr:ATP-grasp domain-containing protein [Nannocystaceae bacterium]
MLWILERDTYGAGSHPLEAAVKAAGYRLRSWDDAWARETPPKFEGGVLFHGSLGVAAEIAERGQWAPGAFCNRAAFRCSRWYPAAARWLLHDDCLATTVRALSADPIPVAGALADASGAVFVRPDCPLKPFSGRVVQLEGLTPASLDHGFYYDDLDEPIVVSRTQALGAEWRFVVCEGVVVTGCQYEADGRQAVAASVLPAALALAQQIARAFTPPDPVFVLDLVHSDAGLKLLEINPFSGADLYACDHEKIVATVGAFVTDGRG